MDSVNICVGGRLCIVGEHSDWAGGFRRRRSNSKTAGTISPGQAIVANTDSSMAIHARARKTSVVESKFLFIESGKVMIELDMEDKDAILDLAMSNSFFAYVAGTLSVLLKRYQIHCKIEVEIIRCTLPMGKGLSSSAAICTLIAKAFDSLLNLKLSNQGIMEIAYSGERLTGSLCGYMDQVVAYGPSSATVMEFDGDVVSCTALNLDGMKQPIYLVFADLNAYKDTKTILHSLQVAYPAPHTEAEKELHRALGESNLTICHRARHAIERGDPIELGMVMREAQAVFDKAAIPLCEMLKSPKLHSLLHEEHIASLTYGGKGVGSQGDGTIQFVARSRESADALVKYLEKDPIRCRDATILVLSPKHPTLQHTNGEAEASFAPLTSPRVAIIPTAGLGTRLFPASAYIRPKSMMPLIDPADGRLKPLLMMILEECFVRANLAKVILVVAPGEEESRVRSLLKPFPAELYEKLSNDQKKHADSIQEWVNKVEIALQPKPLGFGHAVYCGMQCFRRPEPFILLLGDVLLYHDGLKSPGHPTPSLISDMIQAYDKKPGTSILGLTLVDNAYAGKYGCVNGAIVEHGPPISILDLTVIVEKPKLGDPVIQELFPPTAVSPHGGQTMIILGPYVFSPGIFDTLKREVEKGEQQNGEIQLTPAIQRLSESELVRGLLHPEYSSLDIGVPHEYAISMNHLGVKAGYLH